ncbi:sugar transferase [Altericroceibacterium xinjiangense]|uniref:sugar transferase n=1 Tax=Altericroceibacterium xinjiangense TaxID=762261 RepID=UPI0019D1FD51|nr:sugar transferase [Altericroceibacterium xinjiangense]
MVKRLFDIAVVVASLPLVAPLAAGVALAIWMSDGRPVLYWSERVGRGNRLFRMPKFRTMRRDTPPVATHLLRDPDAVLIPIGRLLRTTSLDEIPQLWSVLRGDMSLVGPRPALFNQGDLIALRTQHGIDRLVPGVTGWAQVNGRDELSIPRKVDLEREYMERKTFAFDVRIIFLTLASVVGKKGVHH